MTRHPVLVVAKFWRLDPFAEAFRFRAERCGKLSVSLG